MAAIESADLFMLAVGGGAKPHIQDSAEVQPRRKKKKRKLETSLSLNGLDKTKNLFDVTDCSELGGNRMTIEILDDASPDTTPRGDKWSNSVANKTAIDLERAKDTYKKESHYRNLQFQGEKKRVLTRTDIFVPGPGVTVEDVDNERARLTKIEDSGRQKHRDRNREVQARLEYLEKDKKAIKIQALFRGNLGRKRYALIKRVKSMANGDWIEVRDAKSGDVWYYNTVSGVSQWERPKQMQGKVAPLNNLKRLPTDSPVMKKNSSSSKKGVLPSLAQEAGKTATNNKLQNMEMDGTQTVEYDGPAVRPRGGVDMATIRRELEDQLHVEKMIPPDNLLNPDGGFKAQLRTTVQDALLQSRFDSVATVLADERWFENNDAFERGNIAQRPITAEEFARGTEKIDYSRKPIVAVMNLDKKKKKSAKIRVVDDDPDSRGLNAPFIDRAVSNLTVGQVPHPGLDDPNKQPSTMCFACWSTGSKRGCAMHPGDSAQLGEAQTMLLCRNWELNVMRRRYRSEEIQEIFMKKASSLRYDIQRKKFRTVVEQRHPIYRAVSTLLAKFNSETRLHVKVMQWMRSFVEEIRKGEFKPTRTADKARLMRVKRSLVHYCQVRRYTDQTLPELPLPPVTGFSWPERIGEIQYLFFRFDQALGADVQDINVYPHPVPIELYLAREYHLPVPKSIPMPKPEYGVNSAADRVMPGNKYIDDMSAAAWLERMCSSVMRLAVSQAGDQVRALTPLPGLEMQRRTKYPIPSSVKFATLGRKPTPGMIAVGGLPVELLVSQLVTTYIPTQYGNFMVMDKSPISPGISPEVTITFESNPMLPYPQVYVFRAVEHPLNHRRSPSISICSKVSVDDRFYYGINRPEQTGESESHGFRTTAWARHLLTHIETDPYAFTPGAEIVSLNVPGSNRAVNTHADHTYPFCEPSTRDNTTLDFYHLLLTGVHSMSKAQVFTALTVQDPGQFLQQSRADLPLGTLLVSVYRSWAFTQKDTIVEFKSDDGVPYWYHRRTGQTFWERPLYDEEKVSPLQGGSILDLEHPEEPFTMHKSSSNQIKRRYLQGEFRKLMLNHHETNEEATRRRVLAQSTAHRARRDDLVPLNLDNASKSGILGISLSMVDDDALPEAGFKADNNGNTGFHPQQDSVWTGEVNSRGPQSVKTNGDVSTVKNSVRDGAPVTPAHRDMNANGMATPEESMQSGGMEISQASMRSSNGAAQSHVCGQSGQEKKFPTLDASAMHNLTKTLENMVSNLQGGSKLKPEDMIQFGLGVGLALVQSGAVTQNFQHRPDPNTGSVSFADEDDGISFNSETSASVSAGGIVPIGLPNGTIPKTDEIRLNHDEEIDQYNATNKDGTAPLTAMQKAMEIKVTDIEPTKPPDEATKFDNTYDRPLNADEEMKANIPVLVYPQLSTINPGGHPPDFNTHPVAGTGTNFVLEKDAMDQHIVKGADKAIRRAGTALPIGFYQAIASTRVAKQAVDYLPQVPNLPLSRAVGRVKPRSAAIDWLTIGFDPWSAGKNPLSMEFIPSLATKGEQLFNEQKLLEAKTKAASDGIIDVEDTEGLAAQNNEALKASRIAEDFKKACSLARHGKFVEVEELMNQPDWNVSMEYKDEQGNTLLHIAAQNGNKRMIKLCLRREADINSQNLSGQTPLHYAYAYGYSDVGEYLIRKGADDTIRNKDKLTCYEGLDAGDLSAL